MIITQEYLKNRLSYNPETGIFIWLTCQQSRYIGKVAGYSNYNPPSNKWYYKIKINGKLYAAHRLAWLYMTGNFPEGEIDHINQDSLDNRFSNLRDASREDNNRNKKLDIRNTSGISGVTYHSRKKEWMARIGIDGKYQHIGYYKSKEEAIQARLAKEKELGYHSNHGK